MSESIHMPIFVCQYIECKKSFPRRAGHRKHPKYCNRDCYKNSRRDWENVPYPMIWYKGKREYLHRVIWMEANPNETLTSSDVIHHIDENPFNRDISNLEKLENQSDHFRRHNYQRHNRIKKNGEPVAPRPLDDECPF